MTSKSLERADIIAQMISVLKPLEFIDAVWEGGAASWRRLDEWSDIDLYVVCDDERVEDTLGILEKAVTGMSEIDLRFRVPEPAWHGHSQVFWRLKNASPYLFLDIAVMKRSSKDKFLQYRIHGAPLVHFDKTGIVKDDPVDMDEYAGQLAGRLEVLKAQFELFQVLVLKELNRGNGMEAMSYYVGYTLRPLVEALRMEYTPWHYRFFTTYIYYELPNEINERLERLYFVGGIEGLKERRAEAEQWFWETVAAIDPQRVRQRLGQVEQERDHGQAGR